MLKYALMENVMDKLVLSKEELAKAGIKLEALSVEVAKARNVKITPRLLERLAWTYINSLEEDKRLKVLGVLAGKPEALGCPDERDAFRAQALSCRKEHLQGKYALSIMSLINKISNLARGV